MEQTFSGEQFLLTEDGERAPQNIVRLDDFISYFESTWLVGSYPPSLWNVFETKSARTNNHIEGWHSKLKKVVGKAHPNVYEIVEILKREQGVTEITITQLASGAIPPRRGKKSTDKDKRIQELNQRFSEKTITLEEYVQGIFGHTNI